jgi:tRNA(fMet)-specific endonuclease VapC
MELYVFDTDVLSLLREGHPAVCARVALHSPSDLAVTVIAVEEHLTGWYTLVRRARDPEQLERAYQRLADATQFFAGMRILNFSQAAMARYEELARLKLNIGKMDLRIAAIVLEAGATLVTRNLRDFRRVPGLVVEDWTAPDKEQGTSGGESSRTETESATEPAENADDRPLDGGAPRA